MDKISRRTFLKQMGIAALLATVPAAGCALQTQYPGKLMGPSAKLAHRLRDKTPFPAFSHSEQLGTVIVGGGIAGLSAGWWLLKNGYEDFVILEMEDTVGGNARGGQNNVSAYPWGAHYVPVPGPEARLVKTLFEELDVITGYDAQSRPVFNELYLCHEPEERLLKNGRWQEGIIPQQRIALEDRAEIEKFLARMEEFRHATGCDGRRAFVIPLALSSADETFRQLDRISMAQWLAQEGFTSKVLRWFVDYSCRDDYGAPADQVSAWAGIHYFASRNGVAANADADTVLTWPDGNGWIVSRLREKLAKHIRTGAMTHAIAQTVHGATVEAFNPASNKTTRFNASQVIFTAPRFVAKHVIAEYRDNPPAYLSTLSYAPWLVANVTLSRVPGGEGIPVSWDNVSYHSRSLGYVMATHQNISVYPAKTVVTWYMPLDHGEPSKVRHEAYMQSHSAWANLVAGDLYKMNPDLKGAIENIDVWVWGHGMIRPTVDFIWGENRHAMQASFGRIHFAHSDMSGISIFEEAQYHGVEAAKSTLRHLAAHHSAA